MTTDNMSNEEVIEVLKGIVFNGFDRTTRKERQALHIAIKALKERPQGYYIGRLYFRPSTNQYDCQMYMCSECGEEYSYDAETGIGITDYSFCPKCGADMRKGRAEL